MTDEVERFFAIVRAGDPAPGFSMSPDSLSGRRVAELIASKRLRRRRTNLSKAGALVAASFLLTAAGIGYLTRSATQVDGVVCFEGTDLQSTRTVVIPADTANPGTADCLHLWEDGTFATKAADTIELTGCVAEDGRLLVFPTGNSQHCSDLGLASFDHSEVVSDDRVTVAKGLREIFEPGICVTWDEATDQTRQLLKSVPGGADWILVASVPSPDRPCASYSIDGETRTVTLIPIPKFSEPDS